MSRPSRSPFAEQAGRPGSFVHDCVKRMRYHSIMHRFVLLASAAVLAASPALADGRLGTLEPGSFTCELPGDAKGPVGRVQPQESFSILSASRYDTPQGGGTYLLSGKRLDMTSGPRKGDAYRVESGSLLRKLDGNGQPTRLRCVRS